MNLIGSHQKGSNRSKNMIQKHHMNLTNNRMNHSRTRQKGMYSSRIVNRMLHMNLVSNRMNHSRIRQKDMWNRNCMWQDRTNRRWFLRETIHLSNNSWVLHHMWNNMCFQKANIHLDKNIL